MENNQDNKNYVVDKAHIDEVKGRIKNEIADLILDFYQDSGIDCITEMLTEAARFKVNERLELSDSNSSGSSCNENIRLEMSNYMFTMGQAINFLNKVDDCANELNFIETQIEREWRK